MGKTGKRRSKFEVELDNMITEKVPEIWVNWISVPNLGKIIDKNPCFIHYIREKLYEAGYKRDRQYNAPQETYKLNMTVELYGVKYQVIKQKEDLSYLLKSGNPGEDEFWALQSQCKIIEETGNIDINKAIEILKTPGNSITVETTALSCGGKVREYVDQITNKSNDSEVLSYFHELEVYQIKSLSICSNDFKFSLDDVRKKLEEVKENAITFNIKEEQEGNQNKELTDEETQAQTNAYMDYINKNWKADY
jgi:hypothetical protein